MKSIQDIIDNQNAEAYRAERDRLKNALDELNAAYKATSSPYETLGCLSDIDTAEVVIATLVNSAAHDGRISNANKEWAQNIGYNNADAIKMGIVSDVIHRAHLDQLASAIYTSIRAAEIYNQQISYGSSKEAPPALKRAVRIARRIMMERKEKESKQNNQ